RNSTTKSGHNARNFCFSVGVRSTKRERCTQDASGARVALLGNLKPVDESAATPLPSFLAHTYRLAVSAELRLPVSHPAGGIIVISPSAVRSRRKSRLTWQSRKNSS